MFENLGMCDDRPWSKHGSLWCTYPQFTDDRWVCSDDNNFVQSTEKEVNQCSAASRTSKCCWSAVSLILWSIVSKVTDVSSSCRAQTSTKSIAATCHYCRAQQVQPQSSVECGRQTGGQTHCNDFPVLNYPQCIENLRTTTNVCKVTLLHYNGKIYITNATTRKWK